MDSLDISSQASDPTLGLQYAVWHSGTRHFPNTKHYRFSYKYILLDAGCYTSEQHSGGCSFLLISNRVLSLADVS